jgi:hypothetical protein
MNQKPSDIPEDDEETKLYKMFQKEKPRHSTIISSIRFVSFFVSTLITSAVDYTRTGGTHPEWTLAYHMYLKSMKTSISKFLGDLPDIVAAQNGSMNPTIFPIDIVVSPSYFKPNSKVVSFLENHAPGEWPTQASDVNHKVYYETVMAGNQHANHIIYLMHGGGYIIGSAQVYRKVTYALSKSSACPVFGI